MAKPTNSPSSATPSLGSARLGRRRVPEALLAHWNCIDAVDVVKTLADHAKADISFRPRKDPRSMRWHASFDGKDFSLVLTGPMFSDDHDKRGGWGAVKLVQHLMNCDFLTATKLLREDPRAKPLLPRTAAA